MGSRRRWQVGWAARQAASPGYTSLPVTHRARARMDTSLSVYLFLLHLSSQLSFNGPNTDLSVHQRADKRGGEDLEMGEGRKMKMGRGKQWVGQSFQTHCRTHYSRNHGKVSERKTIYLFFFWLRSYIGLIYLSFYLFYFLIDNDQHAQTHIDKMLTSAKFASLRFIANIIIEMLKLMPKIFADAAARRPVAWDLFYVNFYTLQTLI